ncbi:hypothetical protein KXX29_003248 [Aspergillus fumigatus]|nr:hypothetical protein KXX29_003248 [Aspergillus fumigatus]KAH1580031.1 hypothetical protein KXX17_003947 [Aspergillus fumigatus]KAH2160924.1 hypothetical protein KXW33_004184 [Aspergillus fumigatus]KAH2226093.1 hypothetical protein KXV37_007017 [Aspergillus fumigatus]KAH2459851.1 hypothetical protein KXW63_001198 [Aspergillus fumigatus]
MSNKDDTRQQTTPILRLRDKTPTELNTPRISPHPRDGPWMRDPSGLKNELRVKSSDKRPVVGVTMDEFRAFSKVERESALRHLKKLKAEKRLGEMKVIFFATMWRSVDMMRTEGWTDDEIESALEKYYTGAQHYLTPNNIADPRMIEQFGADWGLNARGIYYRHFYSPGWVTSDHELWLPSLDGIDWNHFSESSRLSRAEAFLKHVLNNERWKKSEYAWEADAWSDVFGQMKNDPVLAVDKHEYNTVKLKRDPVSCLLVGEPKFVKRIPDATFGLATFKPKDYQNILAEWDLDHDRLEALLLHRHCGLISDPRWGYADLAFPFAVYEAKGWGGNAREARRQGCSAGAVYLDMLDSLARQPGKVGEKNRVYQPTRGRSNNQVFVFTSFGAHWHILVGYKRPRQEREYAGHEGFSESVYIFQRIWSGRVVTIRKAWELLSLVDQIHLWGATDFRNSIIQYLKPWHEFSRRAYANDVEFVVSKVRTPKIMRDGKEYICIPAACLQLPDWANRLSEEIRGKLLERVSFHFYEAYQRDRSALSDQWPCVIRCLFEDCGPPGTPGYPILSEEEMLEHYREIHGKDDEAIADLKRLCGETEAIDNNIDPLQVRKRKRSGSGEPGPCTKRR